MMALEQFYDMMEWFFPLYYALYFAWPPVLIYLIGHRRQFLARLITLWTLSGALSVLLVVTHLNAAPVLPALGPEPYNTIILVSIRLALLVTLACLSLERRTALQPALVA
ncbi:MAG: hypothetical protein DYG89_44640 [Caldilinea sp. CFX5]|nr:hypothetical protein [Caldilinea sp. CFX5]